MSIRRRDFLRTAGAGLALVSLGGAESLLAACGAGSAPASATAPAGGASTVKLGILTDLTGPFAGLGKSLLNNVQLAYDQVGTGKFDLIVEDMATDPKTSVEKATKLVQSDKVAAVLGVISSAAREAVRPVISDRAKVPFIYTTPYEGGDCNTNLWCVGVVPPQEVNPYVDWLLANRGKKFYVFGADYVWPRSMFAQTRQRVEAAGGTVLGEDYVPLDATDFTTLVSHLRSSQPEVLLAAFPTPAWTNTVQQISDAGLRGSMHIATYFMSDLFAEAIPAPIRDGISSVGNYFYDVQGDANQQYLAAYRKKFGEAEPTEGVGLGGYTALNLYADAIKTAGSPALDSMKPALTASKFASGPTGPVAFNPDHHLTQSVYVAVTQEGRFKIVQSYPNAQPSQGCSFG